MRAAPTAATEPEPEPERVRGVYPQGNGWIADLRVAGGGKRRQYFRLREDAVNARRASETHPVPRTAPGGFGVRRKLREKARLDDEIPTIDAAPLDPYERGGDAYVPLDERGLPIIEPDPMPPMPPGWHFNIYSGQREPITPDAAATANDAAPERKHPGVYRQENRWVASLRTEDDRWVKKYFVDLDEAIAARARSLGEPVATPRTSAPTLSAGQVRARLGLPDHHSLRGVPQVSYGRYTWRMVRRWLLAKFAAGAQPFGLTTIDDVIEE